MTSFSGYGLGSYCFFDVGIPIQSDTAFSVPDTSGVQLHDLLTRFLNGSGSINHVVNGASAAVDTANPGPSYLVSYPCRPAKAAVPVTYCTETNSISPPAKDPGILATQGLSRHNPS